MGELLSRQTEGQQQIYMPSTIKLQLVKECDERPPREVSHKGHNFGTEHVTANSCLHAQLGIRPSLVVTFH